LYINVKGAVFWHLMLCSLVDVQQQFGGTCWLHLEGGRKEERKNRLLGNVVNDLPDFIASHIRMSYIHQVTVTTRLSRCIDANVRLKVSDTVVKQADRFMWQVKQAEMETST
jgi:hypothetical protein